MSDEQEEREKDEDESIINALGQLGWVEETEEEEMFAISKGRTACSYREKRLSPEG